MAVQHIPRKLGLLSAAFVLFLGLGSAYFIGELRSLSHPLRQDTPGLSTAPQASATPAQSSAPIIIIWTTKSEINTAGFNLYRAQSEHGEFVQINQELIPAVNDPVTGGTYVFTDTLTAAGLTYYYQLEDIDFSGTRTRHGTISYTAAAQSATIFGVTASNVVFGVAAIGLLAGLTGLLIWIVRRK